MGKSEPLQGWVQAIGTENQSTGDTLAVIPTLRFFCRPPDDSATTNFPPLDSPLFFQLL
jgi:hypothetical protein